MIARIALGPNGLRLVGPGSRGSRRSVVVVVDQRLCTPAPPTAWPEPDASPALRARTASGAVFASRAVLRFATSRLGRSRLVLVPERALHDIRQAVLRRLALHRSRFRTPVRGRRIALIAAAALVPLACAAIAVPAVAAGRRAAFEGRRQAVVRAALEQDERTRAALRVRHDALARRAAELETPPGIPAQALLGAVLSALGSSDQLNELTVRGPVIGIVVTSRDGTAAAARIAEIPGIRVSSARLAAGTQAESVAITASVATRSAAAPPDPGVAAPQPYAPADPPGPDVAPVSVEPDLAHTVRDLEQRVARLGVAAGGYPEGVAAGAIVATAAQTGGAEVRALVVEADTAHRVDALVPPATLPSWLGSLQKVGHTIGVTWTELTIQGSTLNNVEVRVEFARPGSAAADGARDWSGTYASVAPVWALPTSAACVQFIAPREVSHGSWASHGAARAQAGTLPDDAAVRRGPRSDDAPDRTARGSAGTWIGTVDQGGVVRYAVRLATPNVVVLLGRGDQAYGWQLIDADERRLVVVRGEERYEISR